MISLDVETTGLDLRHGAKPFMVQTCNEEGIQQWWEWDVNPQNREPNIPREDLKEIQQVIDNADYLVLQNPKFDVAALQVAFRGKLRWNWHKVYDTLLAGHLLGSNEPHDLTSMVLMYANANIQPYEDAVKQAVNEARRMCRSKNTDYSDWRIAKPGLPEMPSIKGTPWKSDMWLPRVFAIQECYAEDHSWWSVCADYGNTDSEATLALFIQQKKLLEERELWKIYKERLKVLPIVCKMEARGITLNRKRLQKLRKQYKAESEQSARLCINIAASCGQELDLPKSGNNKSLVSFIFGEEGLALAPVKTSKKTGAPSLDKEAMDEYLSSLPEDSKPLRFLESLRSKRKRDTALAYMEGYERFQLPLKEQGWYCLHPSLNPTGTHTLRWSSQNPNEQNISKQEGFNLRYCFGPGPGREWWSLDAQNLELRIPAYEAKETEMIKLFEKPNDAPFFGSMHLLMFSIVYPQEFQGANSDVKKLYPGLYIRVKSGDFAVQYGSIESSGTADKAYGVKGAFRKIKGRFKKIHGPDGLNEQMIAHAEKHGYVETMPDKTVDPERGYPLQCTRSNYGRISPTIPLNFWTQGTACWWIMKAMIRVQKYLDGLNCLQQSPGYFMIMQVHDELVFDFPKSLRPTRVKKLVNKQMHNGPYSVCVDRTTKWGNPFLIGRDGTRAEVVEKYEKWIQEKPELLAALPELTGKNLFCHCYPKTCHADVLAKLAGNSLGNLPTIRRIAKLMEQGGDDIGVPTPVSVEYHASNWSEGVSV